MKSAFGMWVVSLVLLAGCSERQELCASDDGIVECTMETDVGQTGQAVLTNPLNQVVGPNGESCGLWGCGFGSDGAFISGAPASTSNIPNADKTVSVITRWDEDGWFSTCILGCCYARDGSGSCDRGGSLYCTEKRCDTVESFIP